MANGVTPGVDLGKLFNDGMSNVADRGSDLNTKMDTLLSQDEVSPEEMLVLQFQMSQYTTVLESLSTVTKGLSDAMKSIAQRAG